MKTYAVIMIHKYGDRYYETFKAKKYPNHRQIRKAFAVHFGDEIDYLEVCRVWEVKPTITIK
jgi:hypothetical protein